MGDRAGELTIEQVEGGSIIPIRALVQVVLEHFDLNVHVELPLEKVGQPLLHTWMQFLASLYVNLESFALADVFPELRIVARQDK